MRSCLSFVDLDHLAVELIASANFLHGAPRFPSSVRPEQ
jgi:hypothetical protein